MACFPVCNRYLEGFIWEPAKMASHPHLSLQQKKMPFHFQTSLVIEITQEFPDRIAPALLAR